MNPLVATESKLAAPVQGSVIAVEVQAGQSVAAGAVLVLLESMKMEWPLQAPWPALVLAVDAAVGEAVDEGQPLIRLRRLADAPAVDAAAAPVAEAARGPRADLQRLLDRRARLADAARPEAMARR
ncbi:MAG: acetyl-CoA carboxylase biotin carboxyl carrier protein subunit, partial [Betaproteobacteria bacterium]